jgi:hypothetical protein
MGVIFLFYGVGKFMVGIGVFAAGTNQHFAGKLPSVLVLPFLYILPFGEVLARLSHPVRLVHANRFSAFRAVGDWLNLRHRHPRRSANGCQ